MSLDIPSRNPAEGQPTRLREPDRIPMSVPHQRLAVPEIPGYHLHWMLGTTERILQARRAGYDFVSPEEVEMHSAGIADGPTTNGSTDMGSQVSVVAGGRMSEQGQPVRLILMKLPLKYWDEDQKLLEKRSDELVAALRAGQLNAAQAGETEGDRRLRYASKSNTMFTKRRG